MGGIFGHYHDALKFESSAVWRFYTGSKSFRKNAKLPSGAAGNPFFEDFMNTADAPTAKTNDLLSMLFLKFGMRR